MNFRLNILLFLMSINLLSCGTRSSLLPLDSRKEIRFYAHATRQVPERIRHVKGTWSALISHRSDELNLAKAQFKIETLSSVGIDLKFAVDGTDFAPPDNPIDGILSFGKFSLENLRDNNLKICGDSGKKKCQFAAIRVYTIGTPGAGYWNTEDNYGLPISSGDFAVPHLAENALYLEEVDISRIRVLKLRHFSDAIKNIPISIDFSDAASGSYSTELVIDYVLY
ncbi:MAG: hypothetical protein AB8G05_19995 [Oligoflexales bacterium]